MSKMQYPKTATALSTALRHQKPEPYGPHAQPPAQTTPLSTEALSTWAGPQPPPAPPLFTYEPHWKYPAQRVHVYRGKCHLGDLVAFPSGYRAYQRDDTPVEGLWADRETAARALEAGR